MSPIRLPRRFVEFLEGTSVGQDWVQWKRGDITTYELNTRHGVAASSVVRYVLDRPRRKDGSVTLPLVLAAAEQDWLADLAQQLYVCGAQEMGTSTQTNGMADMRAAQAVMRAMERPEPATAAEHHALVSENTPNECKWVFTCHHPSVGTRHSVILGDVPACERHIEYGTRYES